MPELPDVEVFRDYMNRTSLYQIIRRVEVESTRILGRTDPGQLKRCLEGRSFRATSRHGKYLFCFLEPENWLVLHFGMTGFLRYFKDSGSGPKHIRVLITFQNGCHLAYDCQRKLGHVDLVSNPQQYITHKKLGPDPLNSGLDPREFAALFGRRRGSVKSALMNQRVVAGIGNIYSDEILFHAGIHPLIRSAALNEGELEDMFYRMKEVLEVAIQCRSDPQRFPGGYLLPHRAPAQSCPICGGLIDRVKVGGRTSYFCTRHQKYKG